MKTLLALVCLAQNVFGANILYVSTLPSPSHQIFNKFLALELAQKGHNVTYSSPDKDKQPKTENYTYIQFEGVYEELSIKLDFNQWIEFSIYEELKATHRLFSLQCEIVLKTKGFEKLITYPKDFKFDLLILENTAGACTYSLIHRFHYPPTIAVTPFLLPSYISYGFGNPLHPSFLPSFYLKYSTAMSFIERFWNFGVTYFDIFLRYYDQIQKEQVIVKKRLGDDVPSLVELERHISLVLANIDPVLDISEPLPPNIIPVGGLHTKKAQPLPEKLQKLLDISKNGVIVFSLGTNVRSDKLGENVQKELLKAFAKLNETIIWKFESEICNLPRNVIVQKWLPQNDILRHKNVKLFIGHGGALSTQEALYHGVPIITFPFMVDQHLNTQKVLKKKVGTTIELSKVSETYVLEKLLDVLENPMYRQNVKKISEAFRGRLKTPSERAIYWIEYLLRHKNIDFLNLPSRDMHLYKSTGIDLVIVLLLIVLTIFIFLRKSCRIISKKLLAKQETE